MLKTTTRQSGGDSQRQAAWWRAQPANNLSLEWRKNLPPTISRMVPPLIENILDRSQARAKELQKYPAQKDRIAVVVSARLFDVHLLSKTLPMLSRQMEQAGIHGEIFVVLNRGGLEGERFLSGLEGFGQFPETIIGRARRSVSRNDDISLPGHIDLDSARVSRNGGIKLVFINQEDSPVNDGKIRALRDLYEYLFDLTVTRSYRPELLFAIDAETVLYPFNPKTRRIDLASDAGLSQLISATNYGQRIVGAKMWLVPFSDGTPDWDAKVPALAQLITEMHGTKAPLGFNLAVRLATKRQILPINGIPAAWLCGGATLGDYAVAVGTMSTISQTLPSLRVEDTAFSIFTRLMGIETHVDTRTIHTNRCPAETPEDVELRTFENIHRDISDLRNGRESRFTGAETLIRRWMAGNQGLKNIIGDLLYLAAEDSPLLNRVFAVFGGMLPRLGPLGESLTSLLRSRMMVYGYSRQHPDNPLNGGARWDAPKQEG